MLDSTYHLIEWMNEGKSKENRVQMCECKSLRQQPKTWATTTEGKKTTHHLIKQPVYYVLNQFTIPMIIFKNLFEWWDEHESVCVTMPRERVSEWERKSTKPNWNATPARQEQQQEQKYTKRSSEHRCERANERQTFRRTKQTNGRHTLAHFRDERSAAQHRAEQKACSP